MQGKFRSGTPSAISCVHTSDNQVYAGSAHGEIFVWDQFVRCRVSRRRRRNALLTAPLVRLVAVWQRSKCDVTGSYSRPLLLLSLVVVRQSVGRQSVGSSARRCFERARFDFVVAASLVAPSSQEPKQVIQLEDTPIRCIYAEKGIINIGVKTQVRYIDEKVREKRSGAFSSIHRRRSSGRRRSSCRPNK